LRSMYSLDPPCTKLEIRAAGFRTLSFFGMYGVVDIATRAAFSVDGLWLEL
jgi:hypothetical protein